MGGVSSVLRLRSVCSGLQSIVDQAWTRSGALLIPLSTNRAQHPLAKELGIIEEKLGDLRLSALKTLCASAKRHVTHAHDSGWKEAEFEQPLKKHRSDRDNLIAEWLLAGCCSFQHYDGL